jgi:phage terminase large subunit GpA-like protein
MTSAVKKPGSADKLLQRSVEQDKLWRRTSQLVAGIYRRPSDLNGVEWADTYRYVAGGASPGKWKTKTQPIAAGPLIACTDPKIHTVVLMVCTQSLKTETLICSAMYYIHQDPSDILFVHPSQDFAAKFSKGRFTRNIAVTQVIRELIAQPKYRGSENTITHIEAPGSMLDHVGANSPTDLAGRPVRVILLDEIHKYPISAANIGDPVRLAIERCSTFYAQGRSKVIMACSPTTAGLSRIGKEYASSDQRKCFLRCPHCDLRQILTWESIRFSKDEVGNPLPKTSQISCSGCGALWTERERIAAIDELMTFPDHGWRQTAEFVCCDTAQVPEHWDDEGRSLCHTCGKRSVFNGKAGFNCSKLYSKRHRLEDVVQQFAEARGDLEMMRVWTNEAMGELFEHKYAEKFSSNALMARAEVYGPQDMPAAVKLLIAFVDTQDNRLEVLVVGFSWDEESYVIMHHVIHGNPSTQPQVWAELDKLRAMTFKVRGEDTVRRIEAMGIDSGGHCTAAVLAYANTRRLAGVGRVFATRGQDGPIPLWPHRGSISKARGRETYFTIGVSSGKELITARLAMTPPLPGFRKPGYIHFPVGLDAEFYAQLNSERQTRRVRGGREVSVWVKVRERNEAFDLLVGALCTRRYFGRIVGGPNLVIPAAQVLAGAAAPTVPPASAVPPAPAVPIATTSAAAAPPDTSALEKAIEAEDEEAVKIEFEKFIMAHPELSDEDVLSTMRETAEAEELDPLTAKAREECRKLGIGDFAPHKQGKIKPPVVPEETPDSDEGWLRQILEKRRAMTAAQRQALARRPQQPPPMQRSWVRPPRRHGLYAALDDD